VFRVTEVTIPSLAASSDEATRIAEQLKRSLSDDLIGQYLVRLQNDLGVSINENALRQIVGGEN
jgi:peptidyl-prolyl cis-trans isomerase D